MVVENTSGTGAHGGREHQQNWCQRWWRKSAELVPTVVENASGTGANGGREHQRNRGANGGRVQCLWSLLGHCFKQFGCLKMALGSLKRRHWRVEEGGRLVVKLWQREVPQPLPPSVQTPAVIPLCKPALPTFGNPLRQGIQVEALSSGYHPFIEVKLPRADLQKQTLGAGIKSLAGGFV